MITPVPRVESSVSANVDRDEDGGSGRILEIGRRGRVSFPDV